MSIESVLHYLSQHAPEAEHVVLDKDTATVAAAAEAFGVMPAQIAKTLSFEANEQAIMVVMAGDARLDNKKYKQHFGVKARMVRAEQVETVTGHPIGGVCPFAVPEGVEIYCDESLRAFEQVIPAGGSTNSGVFIKPERLAEVVNATWVDLAQ